MKRTFVAILVVLVLATALVVPVSANSAQTHWRGVDSTGAVVVGESSPIEVTKEVLTFDISDFPNAYAHFANEITLPLHTCLSDEDVEYVIHHYIEVLKEYL